MGFHSVSDVFWYFHSPNLRPCPTQAVILWISANRFILNLVSKPYIQNDNVPLHTSEKKKIRSKSEGVSRPFRECNRWWLKSKSSFALIRAAVIRCFCFDQLFPFVSGYDALNSKYIVFIIFFIVSWIYTFETLLQKLVFKPRI